MTDFYELTDADLVDAEQRARQFSGAWTGTSGTLALYLFHAVKQIRRMKELEQMGPHDDSPPDDPAVHLLKTAIHTVSARRKTYGPPREHFSRTVAAINAIFFDKLREPLTEADWAQIMILDKIARAQGEYHPDNIVDVAGYSATWAECESDRR